MAVPRIVKHGEPVLRKACEPVDLAEWKPRLPELLKDMWAAMHAARGVGLAAPQIGLNLKLSVIDVRPEGRSQRLVLINPEIVSREGALHEEEGCLSLPGVYAKITRAKRVRVRALDAHGKPWEMTGEGLLARAFQHEVDHLEGKLFIDHLSFADRLKVMAILRDVKKTWD